MVEQARTRGAANPIGVLTLVQRELVRTYKVLNQVVWPPVITMVLYVVVLGIGLGSRVKAIDGVPYTIFLIPGLIILQVVSATYDETASSFFQGRFLNSIQELLIAPLSAFELVCGYLISAMVRAVIIAALMAAVAFALTRALPHDWLLCLVVTLLVGLLFGAIGLIMGTVAEKFEHVAIPTTFIITPLIFVGGVFTSLQFLPPISRQLSLFNPMVYMVEALRYGFNGQADIPIGASMLVLCVLALAAVTGAIALARSGYKLRV